MVPSDGAPSSPFGGLPVLWFEGEPADEVYVVGADFRERFGWCVGLEAEVAYDLQDVLDLLGGVGAGGHGGADGPVVRVV